MARGEAAESLPGPGKQAEEHQAPIRFRGRDLHKRLPLPTGTKARARDASSDTKQHLYIYLYTYIYFRRKQVRGQEASRPGAAGLCPPQHQSVCMINTSQGSEERELCGRALYAHAGFEGGCTERLYVQLEARGRLAQWLQE